MSSGNYIIENNIPFRVKLKNQGEKKVLFLWVLLFLTWGYWQIKYITFWINFFIRAVSPPPATGGGTVVETGLLAPLWPIMMWASVIVFCIFGLVLGFLFGSFVLEEILWRLIGTETLTISKDTITWSRHIPLVSLTKTYPLAKLVRMRIFRLENFSLEQIDRMRSALGFFRLMRSGAISLDYEKESFGIMGLLKNADAQLILTRLKDLQYHDLPIEA